MDKFNDTIRAEFVRMDATIATSVKEATTELDIEFKAQQDELLNSVKADREEQIRKLFGERGLERYKAR